MSNILVANRHYDEDGEDDSQTWYACNIDGKNEVDYPEFHSEHTPFVFNKDNHLLKSKYKEGSIEGGYITLHIKTDHKETKHSSNGWERKWVKSKN